MEADLQLGDEFELPETWEGHLHPWSSIKSWGLRPVSRYSNFFKGFMSVNACREWSYLIIILSCPACSMTLLWFQKTFRPPGWRCDGTRARTRSNATPANYCLQGEKGILEKCSDLSFLHNIHRVTLFTKYESHLIIPSQRPKIHISETRTDGNSQNMIVPIICSFSKWPRSIYLGTFSHNTFLAAEKFGDDEGRMRLVRLDLE